MTSSSNQIRPNSTQGQYPTNTIVHSPSSSKKEMTDDEIVQLVSPIMNELRREIQSSHSIIPRWDIPQLKVDLAPQLYQQFGEKFLDYVQYQIDRIEIASLVNQASKCLIAKNLIQYPTTAEAIARSKFGKGECHEMVSRLALKCNQLGLESIKIGAIANLSAQETSNNHGFVLLGMKKLDAEIFKKKSLNAPFEPILRNFKQGVLVDPFLGILCPLKNLASPGQDFFKYLDLMSVHLVKDFNWIEESDFKNLPQLEKESEMIYQLAKEMQANNASHNKKMLTELDFSKLQTLNLLKDIVLNHLSRDILTELKRIFSQLNITLPLKKNKLNFWIEGSPTEMTQVKGKLQELGITLSIKKISQKSTEEKYAGFIEKPSLNQLRKTLQTSKEE